MTFKFLVCFTFLLSEILTKADIWEGEEAETPKCQKSLAVFWPSCGI